MKIGKPLPLLRNANLPVHNVIQHTQISDPHARQNHQELVSQRHNSQDHQDPIRQINNSRNFQEKNHHREESVNH